MRNTTFLGFLDPKGFKVSLSINLQKNGGAFDLAFGTGRKIATKFGGIELRQDECLGNQAEIQVWLHAAGDRLAAIVSVLTQTSSENLQLLHD